jgi:uncharacterized protein (TIGR03067 family)
MNSEIAQLQGSWRIASLETEGQAVPGGMLNGAGIVVKGERFTTTAMGATYTGTVEVDAGQTPKALNLVFDSGPEKGNTNYGIYNLDGDTWTICLATRGTVRPRKFATNPGSGLALETLTRERRAAGRPAPARKVAESESAGPTTELEGEWAMISGVMDGQPMPPQAVAEGRRFTRGDLTTLKFGPQTIFEARATLNRSATPAAIDYVHLEGMHAGKTQLGIFEYDGQTLKICSSTPGQKRPADFASVPGDRTTFTVWKRVKE